MLYDLNGKAIYAGSQSVKSIYLNSQSIWEKPASNVLPMNYTNSEVAVGVVDGQIYDYGSPVAYDVGHFYSGDTVVGSGTGSPRPYVVADGHIELSNSGIKIGHFPNVDVHTFYVELTFKADTLDLGMQGTYITASNTMAVEKQSNMPVGDMLFKTGTSSSNELKFQHALTGHVTFGVVMDAYTAYFYHNGEQIGTTQKSNYGYWRVFLASAEVSNKLNFTPALMQVYDFKFSQTLPSAEQILQNYQNIQERLV